MDILHLLAFSKFLDSEELTYLLSRTIKNLGSEVIRVDSPVGVIDNVSYTTYVNKLTSQDIEQFEAIFSNKKVFLQSAEIYQDESECGIVIRYFLVMPGTDEQDESSLLRRSKETSRIRGARFVRVAKKMSEMKLNFMR